MTCASPTGSRPRFPTARPSRSSPPSPAADHPARPSGRAAHRRRARGTTSTGVPRTQPTRRARETTVTGVPRTQLDAGEELVAVGAEHGLGKPVLAVLVHGEHPAQHV